jgi:predicted nucleic acid-binding protein
LIVVDANVIAYAVLPGEHSAHAVAALERDPDWVAPPLWQSEVRNVLATTVRVKGLSLDLALGAWGQARRLVVDVPVPADTARILRLATESGSSAYDCEYVALAESLGIRLVTGHERLARRFRSQAVHLRVFGREG